MEACFAAGFVVVNVAKMMLQKEKCFYQPCNIGSIFKPKLQGKFLATENFFHTSKICCSVASLQHILWPYFITVLQSLWMMKG
ncbi:putative nucleoside phosphatase GDA1/CD39 [Rosa chinensis]|uniref:Putative nucleoside phosphatase GDA1/CD39 n=1 Tax=Rosa chinensis TaxID=74649 RepID=A0A2P6RYS9_ROSCH|nr:putative nucleoside phosphatase GDA1/CD39 [Rosa chinensis]